MKKYACRMEAEESCDSSKALKDVLQRRVCVQPRKDKSPLALPGIDVFVNPGRVEEKKQIIRQKQDIAKNFFKKSDMQTLYPELFRILWESTLPCFSEENEEEHMMLSCQLAGVKGNCSDFFIRVPTDSGMCCALNVQDSLRESVYQSLVRQMQGHQKRKKVRSHHGRKNGLQLILDLHSNTVSFGTLDQQNNAFSLFIGEPAQFPMMQDKSVRLQPGREHYVDLSATVVSTRGIKDVAPQARGCFFTDEGSLEFYKIYTFSNCRLECMIKKAEERYKCIPWHLPKVCPS